MATSTFPATGGFVDNTSAATFVPEIWSDEIRAAYEKNLILANLVKKMSMSGKKGDTIHIPAPIRGAAYAKAENTAVTVQNDTESEVQVVIDKHYEYSRIIEDITEVQALASLRNFYTGDAGYALSRQVDNDLFQLGKSLGDGDGSAWANSAVYYNDASTGLTAYAVDTVAAADVFTDAGFRALIQKQDDADVPMDNRAFVIPHHCVTQSWVLTAMCLLTLLVALLFKTARSATYTALTYTLALTALSSSLPQTTQQVAILKLLC
jgi:hypothetical protein